ncbi:MAG: response regulator [Ferruginibacter sp.]
MKPKLKCVLLIDDDEPTNFISTMLLNEANCTQHIQVAETGETALYYLTHSEYFCNERNSHPCPDIIFLDINMPAMDGWEFLEKYKQLDQKHHGKIIIVMLTTSLNPKDKLKAQNMPEISSFENKPISIEMINRIIETHFKDEPEPAPLSQY